MTKRNTKIKVQECQGVPPSGVRLVSKDFLKHLIALQEGQIAYFIAEIPEGDDSVTTHRLQVSLQTTARRRCIAVKTRTIDDRRVMVLLHERDHYFREAMQRLYPFAGVFHE